MDRAGWNYPSGNLRVSDADRDRALAELSEAFQAGRITPGEFDERSGQALHARTGSDLAGTITPAAIAVLLVALIIYLRVRLARVRLAQSLACREQLLSPEQAAGSGRPPR